MKTNDDATQPPWFVPLYMGAFYLFFAIDWKLGVGWLLWRLGHGARKAWEKKAAASSDPPPYLRTTP